MPWRSIVEVIAYLLDIANSPNSDIDDFFVDQAAIKERLEDAGFGREVVSKAFDWLKDLIEQKSLYISNEADKVKFDQQTIRIFTPDEAACLGLDVRNFLLSLEQSGILDTRMREIVINQLMSLNQRTIDLIDVKWVVLLVLMGGSNDTQDLRSYLLDTMALEV